MLETISQLSILALWLGWLFYWFAIAARNVKPTRWRESATSAVAYRIPRILVVLLFIAPRLLPQVLRQRFLPGNIIFPILGILLVVAGLGFAILARHHLAGNWSAQVALKENHSLIRTGPYRHLRHPIYTGILLAFVGTAVAIGEWRGILSVVIAFVVFVWKSKKEENCMRMTFSEYEQYRQTTAALIPFVF